MGIALFLLLASAVYLLLASFLVKGVAECARTSKGKAWARAAALVAVLWLPVIVPVASCVSFRYQAASTAGPSIQRTAENVHRVHFGKVEAPYVNWPHLLYPPADGIRNFAESYEVIEYEGSGVLYEESWRPRRNVPRKINVGAAEYFVVYEFMFEKFYTQHFDVIIRAADSTEMARCRYVFWRPSSLFSWPLAVFFSSESGRFAPANPSPAQFIRSVLKPAPAR